MNLIARVHVNNPLRIIIKENGEPFILGAPDTRGFIHTFVYLLLEIRKEWMPGDEEGKTYFMEVYEDTVVISSNVFKYLTNR
ncbi:MAG: hypothetical protein KDH96_03685 [Candidatus Riesia sp.]|nr:hypothetical protein [Candidatus Riesia sp.]